MAMIVRRFVGGVAVVALFAPWFAAAHVVVKPYEAPTQAYQDFSMGVPSELKSPTVSVKLLVPSEVTKFTPFVKPGWKITLTKSGDTVTAVTWSGGRISEGEKDIFQFTALTPASSTTLTWKAYQTYTNGTVVSWDQDAAMAKPGDTVTPFSTTEVRADLTTDDLHASTGKQQIPNNGIALAALAIAIVALTFAARKR